MKVLCLDFDGVVANSIIDCFVTAYNVYLKFNPSTKILGAKPITYENIRQVVVGNKPLFDKFWKLSTFASGGKYYVVVFYAIEANEDLKSQLEFDVFCSNFFDTNLGSFQTEFYLERKRLQDINMDKWFELSPPVAEVVPQFRKLLEEGAYIVTSKDEDATLKLCKKYEIEVDAEKILDKDFGLNKADKLSKLAEQNSVDKADVCLVDDLLKHVLTVNQAGFKVYMADWGYNTPEQRKEAEKLGIPLLKKENFYDIISAELEK